MLHRHVAQTCCTDMMRGHADLMNDYCLSLVWPTPEPCVRAGARARARACMHAPRLAPTSSPPHGRSTAGCACVRPCVRARHAHVCTVMPAMGQVLSGSGVRTNDRTIVPFGGKSGTGNCAIGQETAPRTWQRDPRPHLLDIRVGPYDRPTPNS